MSCRRVSPHTHITDCISTSVKLEYGSQEGQVIGRIRQLMQLLNELRVYVAENLPGSIYRCALPSELSAHPFVEFKPRCPDVPALRNY